MSGLGIFYLWIGRLEMIVATTVALCIGLVGSGLNSSHKIEISKWGSFRLCLTAQGTSQISVFKDAFLSVTGHTPPSNVAWSEKLPVAGNIRTPEARKIGRNLLLQVRFPLEEEWILQTSIASVFECFRGIWTAPPDAVILIMNEFV